MQVTEGARMLGAAKIIGVDKNSMKKDKGLAFGMTDFINPDECSDKSISQMIKDLTDGMGVDYCFECVGAESLINQAIQATKEVYIYIYMHAHNPSPLLTHALFCSATRKQ
jgi:S-(hydroxymethyl)glutathione dehydrogenase/alcohol dehydrogenase